MMKTIASAALIAATALASVAMFSVEANAQEGAQSIGHGIKCRQQAVTQPNGTVIVQRVCYKGV